MLTLSLLRHAKSSWDDRALDDHERPLAKRGAKAGVEMARYIKREGLVPELVLCSTAVRTRATLALLVSELGPPAPQIRFDDALYLAPSEVILGRVRAAGGGARHVMVIGHNPGMHALALELVGDGDRKTVAALATEFPTAALAVFGFDVEDWHDVAVAGGRLQRFITPRRLAG